MASSVKHKKLQPNTPRTKHRIAVERHFNVLKMGDIATPHIKPRHVTISSSGKFLCIKTIYSPVTVIDLQNKRNRQNLKGIELKLAHVNSSGENIVFKRKKVEAVIWKTVEEEVITTQEIKQHTFPDKIVFLKWISDSLVAVVTKTAVYHWPVKEGDEPNKMYDRDENLSINFKYIIDYQTDATHNLLLLIGYRRGLLLSNDGFTELYSVKGGTRKVIDGQAGAFAQFKMEGNQGNQQEFSTLLCYAERDFPEKRDLLAQEFLEEESTSLRDIPYRLHIEFQQGHAPGFTDRIVNIDMDSITQEDDFPVGIKVDPKCDVIYLMTNRGFVYVYHVKTGQLLCKKGVSESGVFVIAGREPKPGIIAMNHEGQVFSVWYS